MDAIAVFSAKGGNGLRPAGNGLRLAVYSFLVVIGSLIGGGAWAASSHRLMAAGESLFGILPMALGKPAWCYEGDGRVLNGGSVSGGLAVFGGAACPTERSPTEKVPYYWENGRWVQAQSPGEIYYDGYIDAVSADPATPIMVYAMRRTSGEETENDKLALVVVEAGQEPLELAPLADMRLLVGRAAISASGNTVVGHSGSGDWAAGYTYRAVRWIRTGTGWSEPEDIGEGTAVSASADGQIIVGNGDGDTRGDATGGNAWVWVAGNGDGAEVTSLGSDARVLDITPSGSMIVGSRPEPCGPDDWCDFFEWPVYWIRENGEWAMHDLPALDGTVPSVIAVAEVDGQAVILGEAYFNRHGGIIRAVVWQPDESGAYGAPLELETLGANPESIAFAYDINPEGVVLGWSEVKPWGDGSSVLWSLKEPLPFRINAGTGDAWYNPATDGQGFFVMVWEDIQTMFVGWFTYDENGGSGGNNYWMTAQGPYADDSAELTVRSSEGGAFDAAEPSPVHSPDGTVTLTFSSCLEGTVSYDIPSMGRQGTIPIQRLTRDHIARCEQLSAESSQ